MSKQSRRRFSAEFKASAVEMATRPGATVSHTARALEIGEGVLHEWIKRSRGGTRRTLSPSGGPIDETEKDELLRLRREIATLRMERDFLKKATAFFAKESR